MVTLSRFACCRRRNVSAMRWDSNAVTSIVHLIQDGHPLCRPANIILAGEDEGGVACGQCVRIARSGYGVVPPRATPAPVGLPGGGENES